MESIGSCDPYNPDEFGGVCFGQITIKICQHPEIAPGFTPDGVCYDMPPERSQINILVAGGPVFIPGREVWEWTFDVG